MTVREAVMAVLEGKRVQRGCGHGAEAVWNDVDERTVFAAASCNVWDTRLWRCAPEPRPKKRVPLEASDVNPTCMIRQKGFKHGWSAVIGARSEVTSKFDGAFVVGIDGAIVIAWDALADDHEISRDFGKTWGPASKEVEE